MPSRKVSRGKIQFESPHYRVYEKQPYLLYVAKSIPHTEIPNILHRDTRIAAIDTGDEKYLPYKYRHPFTAEDNDCLRFAEGLAKGVVRYTQKTCVFQVQGTARKFGVTDQRNIELARKMRKDSAANPITGQAYAIVRTDLRKALRTNTEDLPPYHIAQVIAEEGDWRITMEADAGNLELTKPVFGIYSISDTTKSFHSEYKDMYGGAAAATIVLEKSDE